MRDISSKISKDSINRISIWIEALGNAFNYLQIEKNLNKFDSDKSQYLNFSLADRPHAIHKNLTISSALIEAAIINFRQVFSTGEKGYGISDNQKDPEIKKIRNELIENSINQLGWTNEQFQKISRKIKTQRNGLIAHYDGAIGDFKEIDKGISSRKMVGAHLSVDELLQFESLVKVIYEYLFKLIYG
ncbi:MAG: hypothetical protein M1445_00075 [Bacteroidetes bacterium]|nr:hypothetical protein [Bacteroidota bacterium]MCL6101724.1 hypothetical protein [Bacteroidota bacterium]